MKSLLIATVLTIVGFAAHAEGADEFKTIYSCRPAVLHPDLGMALTVEQGGFAGITQIQVNRFFLGHHTTEQYVVTQKPPERMRLGAPLIFVGEGVQLAINFTTAPLKDGGQYSTFSTLDADGKMQTENLSCKVYLKK